ncbi:MAG TPA: hypothetical protein VFN77_05025 [Acetobacteraceae bacterium]|nr:hypothetical protein [Acetobacteraceae bacterium]
MLNLADADTHAEAQPQLSPLVLSDRLITLAQEAERAGLPVMANRLVHLALAACKPVKYRAH